MDDVVCIGVAIFTQVIDYVNIINKPSYLIYRNACLKHIWMEWLLFSIFRPLEL